MTALLDRKRAGSSPGSPGWWGRGLPLPHAPLGAVLHFPPADPLNRMDWLRPWGCAEAYKELGQHDKEQADRAEAREILREMMRGMPVNPYQPPDSPSGWLAWTGRPLEAGLLVTGLLFVAGAFVVMVPVFFLMGLRQRRDAGGTWRRLFWVSLALAALQTVAVLAAFLLLRGGRVLLRSALPFVTFLVFVINVVRHRSYLAAVKWKGPRGAPAA